MPYGNGYFYNGVSGASSLFLKLDGSNSPMTGSVDWGNFDINNIATIIGNVGGESIIDLASVTHYISLQNRNVDITATTGTITLTSGGGGQIKLLGGQTIQRVANTDTDVTVVTGGYYYSITGITATRTFTLPSAAAAESGKIYIVKSNSAAVLATYITVATTGGNTIDGAASASITTKFGSLTLVSDGVSNWESS